MTKIVSHIIATMILLVNAIHLSDGTVIIWFPTYRVAQNLCGSLFWWIGNFLWFEGTNFCDKDRLFLLGINFCYFKKVPDKSLIIFSFLLSTCNGNKIFSGNTVPYIKPVKKITFLCHSITTSVVTDCSMIDQKWSHYQLMHCLNQFHYLRLPNSEFKLHIY